MERFKELYRIDTARAKWWDYSLNASYFVTIVANNRHNYFGEIVNKEMRRSELGAIAHKCWLSIPNYHPIAFLDEFVVMPNHVHGIITINKNTVENGLQIFESPLNNHKEKGKNFFGPQSQNLASVIRGFKIGVSVEAKRLGLDFAWHPRYHDAIIRDKTTFNKIVAYIQNNPKNWKEEHFHHLGKNCF